MIASNNNRVLWLPNGEEDRAYNWDSEGGSMQRGNAAGIRIDSESALQCTVVLACARALAESLASLPLHIYENLPDGGKKISKAHPLYRRLHSFPNSWQTSFEWREQQVLWVCLWGNAYSLIVPGEAGFATELQPLHPSRMKVERIENGRLRYSYRDAAGKAEIFNQDQILHIRWLSDDGINGMVPVSLAKDAIGLARACEIHGAKFFANGARPGFVLSTDNDMKPEAASALRDNWEVMYRGAANANRTAVLFGGLKPIPLGSSSMVESQSMETRRFQIEEVCRLFRVPPHLVGDLTRSSFSNIEQQSIDFVQHTLLPWCRRFENAFARDLITEDEKYFAEFDTRGMLRGDAAGRASYFQAMWNLGVASINEIRGWENLNPIEGGDTRFVQLNMQTLAKAVTPEAQPEAPAPAEAAPAQAEQIAVQPEPVVDEQIADVSLNGAQINGIIAILDQVGLGALSIDGAASFISLSFPSIPAEKILSIVNGVIAKPAPAPAPAPAARAFCPGEPGSGIDPTCGSGSGGGAQSGVGSKVFIKDSLDKKQRKDVERVFRGASDISLGIDPGTEEWANTPPEKQQERQLAERRSLKNNIAQDLTTRLDAAGIGEDHPSIGELKTLRVFQDIENAVNDGTGTYNPKSGHELRHAVASGLVNSWALSSGDSSEVACGVQAAIKAEMSDIVGVSDAFTSHLLDNSSGYMPLIDDVANNAAVRGIIRAQYEATQEHFKREGITEVTLHRGYGHKKFAGDEDSTIELHMQPASSFSMDYGTAQEFAEMATQEMPHASVVTIKVPVRHILSTAATGMGCATEMEVIVLSHKVTGTIAYTDTGSDRFDQDTSEEDDD